VKDSRIYVRIIDRICDNIPKRQPFWKAILTSSLLVLLIISLLYPVTFWYLPIVGGLVSIAGIIFKLKSLVSSGVVFIGSIFFFSKITMQLSPVNIILLIWLFVLLYAAIIYLNHLVKMDIIKRDSQGDIEDTLSRYMMKWNRSIIKSLILVYLLALLAFMIAWIGSFEFWIRMENIVLLGFSSIFTLAILVLLYVLFIKIPTLYKLEE